MTIIITLPYPPSANHYLGRRGRGTYLTTDAKSYHSTVNEIIRKAGFAGVIQDTDRLAVQLTCHMPDKRKRDLGNVEKVLMDSLTRAGFWPDDSQVDDLRITRATITAGGSVTVAVTLL